jgi:hypothetical protein
MNNVEIDYSDDVLDSKDLCNRLEYLESIKDTRLDWMDAKREEMSDAEIDELENNEPEEFTDEMKEELESLEEAKNYISEWRNGTALINMEHWVKYCEGIIEEIGDVPQDLPQYIRNNIDWKGVADDLSNDYSTIDIMGNTFYYRD